MTSSQINRIAIVVIAGLLGGLGAMLALMYLERATTVVVSSVEGGQLELMRGEGSRSADSINFLPNTDEGIVVVGLTLKGLPAKDFHAVHFLATGIDRAVGAGLHWIRSDKPDVNFLRP